MQFSQNFVADQRWDLPQYDNMIGLIAQEFDWYNKYFFSPSNTIVKGWNIINNGGLSAALDQSVNSVLFNSLRTGNEEFIVYRTSDPALTITLADNSTNYVEVQIVSSTCAPDTVAIWDSTANGGNGQEFTQNVNTENQQQPVLVSNTVAFSGLSDHLPLARVVTSGGAITSIDNTPKNYLYHVSGDFNFGSPRSDTSIGNASDAFQALATAIRLTKGTTNWPDQEWATVAALKEFQNMYFYGGGSIAWDGTNLSWSAAINIDIANRSGPYTINANSIALTEGQAIYIVIPSSPGTVTPVVAAISAVPINPSSGGFAQNIQVLFVRRNNTIYGELDLPELESGQSAMIGQRFTAPVAARLGLTSDTTYEPYTSTDVILPTDDYQAAISKLDAAIGAIESSTPEEETFLVSGSPQTIFTCSVITFSNLNTVWDIAVYRNGVKQIQDTTDSGLADYQKISTTQIQFSYAVPVNAEVVVRLERTGGGGGGTDLTNISVDPQPYSNGAQSLGEVTKAWSALFLKDTGSSQVYKLTIVGGVLTITPVP